MPRLEWLVVAAGIVLVLRLWTFGLWRVYPALFLLFCYFPLPIAALQFIPRNTNRYAYAYFATQPLYWLLYGAVIYEIFRNVLKEHRGIASAGRWTLAIGLALSFAVTLASLGLEWSARNQKFPILYFFHLFERTYFTTALLLILLLLVLLLWFPIVLRRNLLHLTAGLAVFFLARSIVYLLRNLAGPESALAVSAANQAVSVVWITALCVLLAPAGEAVRSVARRPSTPEDTDRLVRQLDRINETLLRAGSR